MVDMVHIRRHSCHDNRAALVKISLVINLEHSHPLALIILHSRLTFLA
jgi:hypothetical protein